MRDKTHFDEIADARGWIVAYPEGTSSSWNAGACCGGARFTGVDDVGFARALITAIEGEWCVDPKRVHVAGFSNGGFMAHRLACELSDVVASIGVVAGEVGVPVCAPKRAVPIAQAHGTLDPLVPYGGNPVLGYPSTMETMNGWAARDGCGMSPVPLATVGDATCIRWPGCAKGADVELCTIANGVHDWFGGGTDWTDAGPPAGFVASTFIADFLYKHPMP
jgi:polyhydroxybutyrate depolymerase